MASTSHSGPKTTSNIQFACKLTWNGVWASNKLLARQLRLIQVLTWLTKGSYLILTYTLAGSTIAADVLLVMACNRDGAEKYVTAPKNKPNINAIPTASDKTSFACFWSLFAIARAIRLVAAWDRSLQFLCLTHYWSIALKSPVPFHKPVSSLIPAHTVLPYEVCTLCKNLSDEQLIQ